MSLSNRLERARENRRRLRATRTRRQGSRHRFAVIPGPVQLLETRCLLSQTFTVTNTLDDGSMGSLRWAINQVNSDTGPFPDTIDFNIPGTGPFLIQVGSQLPTVTNPVVIDGYSQPGSSPNTLTQGDNAVILIDINGANTFFADGLDIAGGGSTVEGLAVNQFNNAIHLETAGGDTVAGNFLGTDTTGEINENNYGLDVYIDNVGSNTVGGTTPADRNIISDSYYEGLQCNGSSATGNLIAGNYIGTDATGTNRQPNGMGVEFVNNSGGNTVGGSQAGAGNLISGNGGDALKIDGGCNDNVVQGNLEGTDPTGELPVFNGGNDVDINGGYNTIGGTTPGSGNVLSDCGGNGIVMVFGSASYNLVEGNLIGTDITGTNPLGNNAQGINMFFGASFNTIGGTVSGAANTIAFNNDAGVGVGFGPTDECPGNAILSNSIFSNLRLGIDLGNTGVVLPNTPGGPHSGANNLQNYPVLNEAIAFTGVDTVITGSLNSAPSANFTLQFFDNPTADPSGYGQGKTLIGTVTITTDSSGNASFQARFPVVVPAGDAISATATDSIGDTSEFSQDVTAIAAAPPVAAINDSYNTDINTTLIVPAPGVQANDVSADGGSFTSVLVTSTTHGTLSFKSNGSFTYVPKRGYTGLDSFTYQDVQNGQYSNVATVTISVNPKTLYVTNTNATGLGSFYQALTVAASSNSPGADTILFDISGSGPFEISPTSPLPALDHPTIINGYSQPGAYENTLSVGDNAVIQIQIDGSNLDQGNGIVLTASGSTVEGLSLTRFDNAIIVAGPGGDTIVGNFLGVNPSGNQQGWGNQVGIEIAGSLSNNVGGSPADRNVISGNNQYGIMLDGGSSLNVIAGNYIGTDASGGSRLGNGTGVALFDAPNNTIGGTSGVSNLISANNGDGILVSSFNNGPGSTNTVIVGNYIGLDGTGSVDLGNNNNGVHIVFGAGTVVGGTNPNDRNVISGNQAGVYLENSATGVLIEGNYIGTDPRGYKAIGNQYDGVLLSGAMNTVGGATAGAGNVISGNYRNGISDGAYAGSVGYNTILGNLIGTDSTGKVAIPNGQDGIDLASTGDTVGGTAAAARNVISGNSEFGIRISGNGNANAVLGNYIGTDKTGSQALGNNQDGVHIQDGAANNTIGGTSTNAGNTIAFNGGAGVAVGDNAVSNAILTNSIFSNGDLGINLSGNGNQGALPPALSSATSTLTSTTIQGTLSGSAYTVYLVQFFANQHADPSGYGEGQTYLGSSKISTGSSGTASFQITFNTRVPAGEAISATSTSPQDNTSGFAADVFVTSASSLADVLSPAAVDAMASDSLLGALAPLLSNGSDSIVSDLALEQLQAKSRTAAAGS